MRGIGTAECGDEDCGGEGRGGTVGARAFLGEPSKEGGRGVRPSAGGNK